MVSILKNAVDSIVVGLEDYSSPDERRIVSCARNVFAGILLLFKHKLVLLSDSDSDEALIKQRVLPVAVTDSDIKWRGKGKKTVDVQGIRERFQSLGIDVDWKRIEKINALRNDIEHYYSNQTHESIRSLISDSFLIISDFIRSHLDGDPKELLGDEACTTLIDVYEVYEREKAECNSELESLTFFNEKILYATEEYKCDQCGSGLIHPLKKGCEAIETEFVCKSCGNQVSYDELVKEAVSEYYYADSYIAMTDGGDSPTTDCPECDGIYLYEERVCSSCGCSPAHSCQACGSSILPEELECSPLCGYCSYKMSKDD